LLIGGTVIDVKGCAEVPFQNIARDMKSGSHSAPRHINSIDMTSVEVPSLHGLAGAVIGVFTDPTWAENAAVAYLQKTAFEMIRHCYSP
jgi:hypothetical protein